MPPCRALAAFEEGAASSAPRLYRRPAMPETILCMLAVNFPCQRLRLQISWRSRPAMQLAESSLPPNLEPGKQPEDGSPCPPCPIHLNLPPYSPHPRPISPRP